MLEIKNISKEYRTGNLVQKALDKVSLNLRDSEFVAILGQSGSGKTTLLNLIGGLDRYDSGDLIINGISTSEYKDADWDGYRNHTVGFVFQSYNLIPHQSVLSNVELALTISGISSKERKRRAEEALKDVGLAQHIHKKPNQLSGGQMQRVAIARALVNNPDILLADEPTGALDSETSLQVMELLKKLAKDRLVLMVTHNPELAESYANRIVRLKDGRVIDDSNPFNIDRQEAQHKTMGRSAMSFLTALSLSFNNLKTKKGRTLLTAFAGSIGIIGIALILSMSNGVNQYIKDIQRDTMSSYPLVIEQEAMDLTSLMDSGRQDMDSLDSRPKHKLDKVYSNPTALEHASSMTASIDKNNLTAFKKYLDRKDSPIHKHIGSNGLIYSYNTKFNIYAYDTEDKLLNTDGSSLKSEEDPRDNFQAFPGLNPLPTNSNPNFSELLSSKDQLISPAIKDNYELLEGKFPTEARELVLVLDKNNEISASSLYELGFLASSDYKELMDKIDRGEKLKLEPEALNYKEFIGKNFYLLRASDSYEKLPNANYSYIADDDTRLEELMDKAMELKLVGIIRQKEDSEASLITSNLAYSKALTDQLIKDSQESPLVKAQMDSKDVNILTGTKFQPKNKEEKLRDTKNWLSGLGLSDKASISRSMLELVYKDQPGLKSQMLAMDELALAQALDDYIDNSPDQEFLLSIYDANLSQASYEKNMEDFGLVSLDAPRSISIYADSFEDKDLIAQAIEDYNKTVKDEDKISYTDFVGLLMSSITTIINVISYVLIAFVGVSLVVSSIMIGIITYISVLERTKEIGILRSIGASKKNISQVFNAETFIIGLLSGSIGILLSQLLLIPGNKLLQKLTKTPDISASLPLKAGLILIVLSTVLTLIGGFIPAKKAARKDPVTALRTD